MSPEFVNTIATIAGVVVAVLGAFLFAFWIAMGIWTFNDIRTRSRDWLSISLAVALVLIFPIIGWILYLMIRPKVTLAEMYDRALEEESLLRELEETLTCHTCGVPVKENWVYCPNCHSQLQHACPTCGALVRNEWDICVNCGAPQRSPKPVQPAPQVQSRPQQKGRKPSISSRQPAAGKQPKPASSQPQPGRVQPVQTSTPTTSPASNPIDDSAYRPQ
jgi:RNA polymerase subunit RPABC4/transcription elongation factor Spt4